MERQSRQPKERVFPQGKEPYCPQQTIVYLKVHAVIRDIRVLRETLTSKANITEVELTLTDIRDGCTYCTLTCDSKRQAKKVMKALKTQSQPLVDCSFEIYPSLIDKVKAELRKTVEQEFDERSAKVMRVHQQKLTETEESILTAKKTRQEIEALEHRLKELQLQKKEFSKALNGFRQKLDSLLKEDDYERAVQSLRKRLEVECCRLERALRVYAHRQDIVQLAKQHPVSVLLADTGSGKSTQVVQYLLDAGFGERGTIVCTQPRGTAAVSLATHVAQELADDVGKEVGYKVGGRVKMSPSTKIVYMTDHALLNECLTDQDLKAFSCVVVDEAHERSLFTDLLLFMVKRCVERRPDLRVIITSASIDPKDFVNFFGSCQVMSVSCRTFPVDVVWQDAADEKYVDAAVKKAVEIHKEEPLGDILVFLTSASEIQKSCDLFQQKLNDRTDFTCFQLHEQLPADEQQKVFEPLDKNKRKIVFATNCAETSVTIDGIRYVVDTGVTEEMRYNAKRNIQSLNVTAISQSSAEERKGRAGLTAPGKCYRLYSQRSYRSMDASSQPEILKTDLSYALLKLAYLGITPDKYDFVQSPSKDAIDAALETLRQVGALRKDDDVITDDGRWIARLPFDPKLGLMILHGRDHGLLYDVIVLAALISARSSLFYRGLTDAEHEKLDKAKVKFCHPRSDCLTSLEVYRAWEAVEEEQKSQWCMDHSVDAKIILEVKNTVSNVCRLLKNEANVEVTQKFSEAQDTPDTLRKIVFKCYASNLCLYLGREKTDYFAARARRQVYLHPSSVLRSMDSYPQWVVYEQLLQTSRDFITGITPVDNAWLQEVSENFLGFDLKEVRQIEEKLVKVFTQPAGSHAFFAMDGPRYTRLRQLQEKCDLSGSSVVIMEASKEVGEVRVLCTGTGDSVKSLMLELKEVVDKAVKDLQREVWEVDVGSEDSRLQVVLGQGAQVVDILMPHETRKIFIHNPSKDATEEILKQKFQKFGEVCRCYPYSNSKIWGFLLFQTKFQAAEAVERTKDDDQNVAQLERRPKAQQDVRFRARLSWIRRPAKDFGFVEVAPAYLSKCLDLKVLNFGKNTVQIEMDLKKENSLYLTNLPADAEEKSIKQALLCALHEKEDASNILVSVTLPREKVEKTDDANLNRFKDQIKGKVEEHLTSSKVIDVLVSEMSDVFVGEVWFSDPVEGLAACSQLKDGFSLYRREVSIKPIFSTTLRVPQLLYDACSAGLEAEREKIANMGFHVKVKKHLEHRFRKRLEDKYCLIYLEADNVKGVVQARACVNDVTKGDVVNCSDADVLGHLLTSAGRQMLEKTEAATSAYISVNNRQKTISIHGPLEACTKARKEINTYLVTTAATIGKEVVTCRGGDRPPGLLKALNTKYGDELGQLRQQAALHDIHVDHRRHNLTLSGPHDSIQKAKQAVEEMDETLRAAGPPNTGKDEDYPDCTVCFSPIDQGNIYRLEACAHPFCTECIADQVKFAIKENHLPVLCCHEGCDVPLAWRDFNNLSDLGYFEVPVLAASALSAYVLANPDKARFCTTPDCPMIYSVTSEEHAKVFICPECNARTCTACNEQEHEGVTCGDFRRYKKERLDAWVQEDPQNRKECPRCGNLVEKTGGCKKMYCTVCRIIFCWLCTQQFASSNDCYDHLIEKHGGIF